MKATIVQALRAVAQGRDGARLQLLVLTVSVLPAICLIVVLSETVWNPLPYHHADELFILENRAPLLEELEQRGDRPVRDLQNAGLFAISDGDLAAASNDSRRVHLGVVSKGFFPTLEPSLLLGSAPAESEIAAAATRPVLITDRLWRNLFGASRSVVGQRCTVNQLPAVIYGVVRAKDMLFPEVDAWLVRQTRHDALMRGAVVYQGLLRLAKSAPPGIVSQQLESLAESRPAPGGQPGRVRITPVAEYLYHQYKASLTTAGWVVICLFLIGLVNSVSVYCFELLQSRRELAIQLALGCSFPRLVRHIVARQQTYAVLSWSMAVLLFPVFTSSLARFEGFDVEGLAHRGLTAVALAASLGVVLLAAGLVALAQIWILRRVNVRSLVQDGVQTIAGSRKGRAVQYSVLLAQLTITITLLVAAGQVLRHYWKVSHVDLGFTTDGVLTVDTDFSNIAVERRRLALHQVASALRQRFPDALIGSVNYLPLDPRQSILLMVRSFAATVPAGYRVVQGDYFSALGIRVITGRTFDARSGDAPSGGAGTACKVVVNSQLARELQLDPYPIGKTVSIVGFMERCEVIGVVAAIRHFGPQNNASPEVFVSFDAMTSPFMTIVLKTRQRSESALDMVRSAVRSVPQAVSSMPKVLNTLLAAQLESERNRTITLVVIGTLAFLLTQIGLYGLVARAVAAGARRIAVELALGASGFRVVRSALSSVMVCVAVSIVMGNVLSLILVNRIGQIDTAHDSQGAVGILVSFIVGFVSLLAAYSAVHGILRKEPAAVLKWSGC
jgi:hypothetical protein